MIESSVAFTVSAKVQLLAVEGSFVSLKSLKKDFAIVTALVVKKQTLGGINHGSKSSD